MVLSLHDVINNAIN